jgi:hypothetical protein
MDMKGFQAWLNARGAALAVDGLAGPKTRQAILDVFRNPSATAATPGDVRMFAEGLGGKLEQMAAVAEVESRGSGWDSAGRLSCLYERHYLWKRVAIKVPLLSDPVPGGYTIDADHDGVNDSWEKVADAACKFGPDKAFECASWGKFQVMGAWWERLGYASALDFVWTLNQSQRAHYDAFARFIRANGLLMAFRRISGQAEDCRAFAKGYNGPAYAKHNYHARIAEAFRALAGAE